ncbi:hypothetical protein HN873_068553 [Arachis hypogaea]
MKKKRLQLQARKATINYYLQQSNFPNNNHHDFFTIIIIIITVTHLGSMILFLTTTILTSQFVKNPKLASTPIIKIQTFWSRKHQIVIAAASSQQDSCIFNFSNTSTDNNNNNNNRTYNIFKPCNFLDSLNHQIQSYSSNNKALDLQLGFNLQSNTRRA